MHMWVAKVKISGDDVLMGRTCKKYNVSALAYPLSIISDKNDIKAYFTMVLYGSDRDKNDLFKEIKKSKRVQGIEKNGDFIIGSLKESKIVEPMYKHSIIHVDPIIIDKTGYEIWTVGSFNKKDLDIFIDNMEKLFQGEVLKFISKKITNISIMTVHPELTLIQKRAIEIALDNGYYSYPRKIDLQELAKIMDISYSTYHAHLRKAEMKLLPFFFNKDK